MIVKKRITFLESQKFYLIAAVFYFNNRQLNRNRRALKNRRQFVGGI
jgi:hypothetical protein